MLEIGINGLKSTTVTNETTAAHLLSGLLPVYATPALIAFMEYTCSESVQAELENGMGTVGTLVNIKHLSASPIGSKITCKSELIEIDGRRLVFKVEAFDDFDLIGEGTHERFIIDDVKFMSRINEKAKRLSAQSDE
ncbi:MAG: thioesterase family protein [Christensenellaceae bacterium]|nr:thioesterase family protein [Christensenellaceae bacterium]